jgi:cation transport ATPase
VEEKIITEQESLSIIQAMIDRTKQQLVDRSKYFLIWGIAVFVCAIIQYLLLKDLQTNTQRVWLVMPVLVIFQVFMSFQDRKKEKIVSHNTAAIGSVWIALGISFFILAFLSSRISFDMFPFLILFYGIGTFITGRIIQFKPLIFGGLACFILCIVITYIEGPEKLLILALSVVLSYIIPGILLKIEFNNKQNRSL